MENKYMRNKKWSVKHEKTKREIKSYSSQKKKKNTVKLLKNEMNSRKLHL